MRMSGAQKNVQKLLDFIMSVADKDSALYDKSKDHLIEIAETCNQIECAIAEILHTAKPRGFNPNAEVKNNPQVEELRKRMDVIETKVDNLSVTKNISVTETQETPVTSAAPQADEVVVDEIATVSDVETSKSDIITSKSKKLSPKQGKWVLHLYAKILQKMANIDTGNNMVNTCYKLIWDWYNKRFLNKYPKFSKFSYDVRNIHKYIYSIVICLGYHIENNSLDMFIEKFNSWIESVGISEEVTVRYALPYEPNIVYKRDEEADYRKYANLTAAILWDLMWDNGYCELSKIKGVKNASLVEYLVYEIINHMNVDILEGYVPYKNQPEILNKLNLV